MGKPCRENTGMNFEHAVQMSQNAGPKGKVSAKRPCHTHCSWRCSHNFSWIHNVYVCCLCVSVCVCVCVCGQSHQGLLWSLIMAMTFANTPLTFLGWAAKYFYEKIFSRIITKSNYFLFFGCAGSFAVSGLSLVAASRGYSLAAVCGCFAEVAFLVVEHGF